MNNVGKIYIKAGSTLINDFLIFMYNNKVS